jgi:UDP-N-acetylglucosamine 1-carboxyvinyltransferase
VIRIEGVPTLRAMNTHTIIPDRIEAGTYLSMAAAVGEGVVVKNVIPEHLEAFTAKMIEMGVQLEINEDSIYVPRAENLKPIQVKTMPFPGFATDLQQPLTPLLFKADGSSVVIDTIYPKRIKHIAELRKMGAHIRSEEGTIVIDPSDDLIGGQVQAGEIRAGASLVIAGLMAEGDTEISQADNILRGYDRIVEKLTALNADVEIVDDSLVENGQD